MAVTMVMGAGGGWIQWAFLLLLSLSSSKVPLKKTEFLPEFENSGPTNITVQEGDTAVIECKISFLNNESVSWVRRRDSHILAVDREVFISDQRFIANIQKLSNLWILKIRYVTARDAGSYECQVSTVPKISKLFHLKVIIPKVDIVGGPHLYVHSGSSLQLECVVSHVVTAPQFVMWQHRERVLPGTTRTYSNQHGLVTKSVLNIDQVRGETAGEYSCLPDNISPATITISIIRGEEEQLAVTNTAATLQLAVSLVTCALVTLLWR